VPDDLVLVEHFDNRSYGFQAYHELLIVRW